MWHSQHVASGKTHVCHVLADQHVVVAQRPVARTSVAALGAGEPLAGECLEAARARTLRTALAATAVPARSAAAVIPRAIRPAARVAIAVHSLAAIAATGPARSRALAIADARPGRSRPPRSALTGSRAAVVRVPARTRNSAAAIDLRARRTRPGTVTSGSLAAIDAGTDQAPITMRGAAAALRHGDRPRSATARRIRKARAGGALADRPGADGSIGLEAGNDP